MFRTLTSKYANASEELSFLEMKVFFLFQGFFETKGFNNSYIAFW